MKGMHPSGYREILISNPSELKKKNGIAVRISAKVGMRKRLEIQKKAEELGIKVLNPVEI
jgi:large subunit ribosomal protein L32e